MISSECHSCEGAFERLVKLRSAPNFIHGKRRIIMKKILLLLLSGVMILSFLASWSKGFAAGNSGKWGRASNGVQCRIVPNKQQVFADESLTFNVYLKNINNTPIFVPTLDAFLMKKHPGVKNFKHCPYFFIIDLISGRDYTCSYNYEKFKEMPGKVIPITPSEEKYLGEVNFIERSVEIQKGEVTNRRYFLLPDSSYNISLRFHNEQRIVNGQSVWTGSAVSLPVAIDVKQIELPGVHLEGEFSLEKTSFFLGEPIFVTFRVRNIGTASVQFPRGGNYRAPGTHDRFSFTAIDSDGERVRDPVKPSGMGGGLGSYATLSGAGEYEETVMVNRWCFFPHPGAYTITCQRTLNLFPGEKNRYRFRLPESVLPTYTVETDFKIRIRRDKKALKRTCDSLLRKGDYETLRWLGYPAAEPYLLKGLKQVGSDWETKFFLKGLHLISRKSLTKGVLIALRNRYDEAVCAGADMAWRYKITEAISQLHHLLVKGDNTTKRAAVWACTHMEDKTAYKYISRLAGSNDAIIRRYVAGALGSLAPKPAQAITLLKTMIENEDALPGSREEHAFVKIWAASALGKLANYDSIPVMIELLGKKGTEKIHASIASTLERLTGMHLGEDYEEWNSWWQKKLKTK